LKCAERAKEKGNYVYRTKGKYENDEEKYLKLPNGNFGIEGLEAWLTW
jgi:hypothetical protein